MTNNVHNIEEVYDLTHSTTLGRGACGSVSTCTHKATSMMYAMKTVSIEVQQIRLGLPGCLAQVSVRPC